MSPLRKRALLVGIVGVLAIGGVVVYRSLRVEDANAVSREQPRTSSALPVIGGTVEQKAMPVRLSAIGTVVTVNSVAVRARLDSQVSKVLVQDGQHVNPGQPLFELDSRQIEAQRQQAEAVLSRDKAQLAFARRNLERKQPNISSEAAIDEARTNVAALEAAIRADQASLENLAVQLSYTHIVAPIAGRLGTIAFKVGSTVKVSDPQPLVTINQLRPVYVAFSVPQSYLARIQVALSEGPVTATASIPSTGTDPQIGRVAYVENSVDSSTSTISVKALFPNEQERLWPGAYVNVEVTLRTEPNALVVPAQAVQMGQTGSYVFVIKGDNTVETREVTLDRTIGEEAIIAKGLSAGEHVVVDGQLRLVNGSRVEVKSGKTEG
jgi:membrane fusion protein, multidrug efflux system